MRFEQLLFLIEVHRCPSLTVACENLHVTRQALSSALKNLEQELDAQLLNRTVKGVTLTEKGYQVLAFAEKLMQLQEEFLEAFHCEQKPQTISGHLRLLAANPLRAMIFPQLFTYFMKHYPNVTFSVETRSASDMLNALIRDETDLIFIHQCSGALAALTPLPPDLTFHPLFEGNPFLWCSKKSPLARHKTVTLAEACRYPIIIDSRIDQSVFQPILSYEGPPRIATILDSSNIYVLEKFLEDDIGILWDYQVGSNMLYRIYNSNPNLQVVRLQCPYRIYGGYVLSPHADAQSQPLSTLLSYLEQTFPYTAS